MILSTWLRPAGSRSGLGVAVIAVSIVQLLPISALLLYSLSRPGGAFTALGAAGSEQLLNTLLLLLLVAAVVGPLGVAIGWLTASCRFRGRGLLRMAQLLPLVAPAYLQAAVLTDLGSRWGLHLHGIGWAAAVLSLTTLPYVALLSHDSFSQSGRRQLEAARSLGLGPWRAFRRVALPMAMPAVAAGVALAGMEVVNEFGAVELLGVPTLSTGLLQRWQAEGDPQGATTLALLALAVVASLVAMERWLRRLSRRWDLGGPGDHPQGWSLDGARAALALLTCGLPPLISLALPLLWIRISWDQLGGQDPADLLPLCLRSIALALLAALLAASMALVLAIAPRWLSAASIRRLVNLAGLGYAVPGAVLALGLLLVLAPLGVAPLTMLLHGYSNRFLTVAKGGLDASLERFSPSLEDAATSLGHRWQSVLRSIHWPLLRRPLLLGGLLVFVDTVKELPLTFALRPFDFDTLAVRVFQYSSDERLGAALVPALLILVVGVVAAITMLPQLEERAAEARHRISGRPGRGCPAPVRDPGERAVAPPGLQG